MERKMITFGRGIHRTPDIQQSGELCECVNLMPVEGEVRNVEDLKQCSDVLEIEDEATYLCLHKLTDGGTNVVYIKSGTVYWKNSTKDVSLLTLSEGEELLKVHSMNNVLILLTTVEIKYYLWKGEAYSKVSSAEGNNIKIRFGLSGNYKLLQSTTKENVGKYRIKVYYGDGTESKPVWGGAVGTMHFIGTDSNVNALLGAVDTFVTQVKEDGKFMYPFLVRYALKTKDGRYICPSTPALMVPNTGVVPLVAFDAVTEGKEPTTPNEDKNLIMKAFAGKLYYQILSTDIDTIKTAIGDVVESLVVAVTPPMYTYKDSATDYENQKSIGLTEEQLVNNSLADIWETAITNDYKLHESELKYTDFDTGFRECYRVTLPEKNINDSIKSADVFRIVKEIKLEDLTYEPGTYTSLDIPDGYLTTLDARPRLTVDTISLDSYRPKVTFEYNSRLHLANVERTLWHGHNPALMQPLCNSGESPCHSHSWKARVEIVKDGVSYYVESDFNTWYNYEPFWFFYPDQDAKHATIWRADEDISSETHGFVTKVYEIDLTPHETLDGAYWFNGLKTMEGTSVPVDIDDDSVNGMTKADCGENGQAELSAVRQEPNVIMASEAFSPTELSSDNVTSVGTGEIKAVSAVTLPISEEFGKQPIACFCSDGLWGLTLKDDGTFYAPQQISGDLLSEGTEPVQSDKAVYFVTEQGMKELTNGEPELVSAQLDGQVFDTSLITDDLKTLAGNIITSTTEFIDAIRKQGLKMAWDYAHNFLHVYPVGDIDKAEAASWYHYIYNIGTKEWIRMKDDYYPQTVIQNYPKTYIQKAGNGSLFTTERNKDLASMRKGYLVTRELSFDDALQMKMLMDLRVMKMRKNAGATCKVAVWASNDKEIWYRVGSLRSHSWKWYRFGLFTNMADNDTVQGIVAGIEMRRTGKMR